MPELALLVDEKVPFLHFLPDETVLVMKDMVFCRERIDQIYRDGFSSQAVADRLEGMTEMEQQAAMKELRAENSLVTGSQFAEEAVRFRRVEFGTKPTGTPQATVRLDITPQPLFHKNFELLARSLEDYILTGYRIYILADSQKQNERLKEILESEELRVKNGGQVTDNGIPAGHRASSHLPSISSIAFIPVDKTLHGGFADNTLKACFFTDHQILTVSTSIACARTLPARARWR